jgi:AraC-like DNA-binding protein
MRPPSPVDILRVEGAIRSMYRRPFLDLGDLLDEVAEASSCSRRQLERAFKALHTTSRDQMREIRAELGAAMLTKAERPQLKAVAKRIGLRDDRALRREINFAWGISPGALRDAASLEDGIRSLRRSRIQRGVKDPNAGLVASFDQSRRVLLKDCPIRTRRLVEGEVEVPTPSQAAAEFPRLAHERVERLRADVLHESELPA